MAIRTTTLADVNLMRRAQNDERIARKRVAFLKLSDADRIVVEGCITLLENQIPKLGHQGAFELVGALGEWMAEQDGKA